MLTRSAHLFGHIRRLTTAPDDALLDRFIQQHDETAFEEMVGRHGPMVLRVCRRLLADPRDAEDAFQAAFLVLARKADSVRPRCGLAAWLHGVARRTALKLRGTTARRHSREAASTDLVPADPRPDPLAELSARELLAAIDEEVARLPEVYRAPVVLCCLEGRSQEEAARLLGWTPGSVKGRLERGRARLHDRLVRRGLTLAAVWAAVEFSRTAGLASDLLVNTVRAAVSFTATDASDLVPSRVADLAREGLRTTAAARAKVGLTLLLALGAAVVVGTAAFHSGPEKEARQAGPKEPPRPREADRAVKDSYGDSLPAGAVARLGTVRWRHQGEAGSVAFSPDGKTVAASTQAGHVVLWESATGRPLKRIAAVAGPLAFSSDGKLLAWQGSRGIHFWDLAADKEFGHLAMDSDGGPGGGLSVLRFSPDGKKVAWGGSGPVRVGDLTADKPLSRFGEAQNSSSNVAFSPDGKVLAVATQNPAVQLFDVATGKLLLGIDAHVIRGAGGENRRFAMAVAFSPDGKSVASAGREKIVVSDAATGKELAAWDKPRPWVLGLAFTPGGKSLVVGDEEGKVRVLDAANGKERLACGGGDIARSVALSPDGKTVVVGTAGTALKLWDVTTGKELSANDEAHDGAVHAVRFSPDGQRLASGGERQQVHVWDAVAGRHERRLNGFSASSVDFSPDGKRLVTTWQWSNTTRVWDVGQGEEKLVLEQADAKEVHGAAFALGGKSVVSLAWKSSTEKLKWGTSRVRVWDADGRHLRDVTLDDFAARCLAVSPDGRLAAAGGSGGLVWVCDVESGKAVLPLRGHEKMVQAVAFSPDGWLIATGGHDNTVRVWETISGKEVFAFGGHARPVAAVAFSPDGRVVASAEGERSGAAEAGSHQIRCRDAVTGKDLFQFAGHDSDVLSLAFSPDGKRLASGQRDSSILLWDMTGQRVPAVPVKEPTPKNLDALWSDLVGADAAKAQAAMGSLTASPDATVTFLKERLRPVPAVDPERVRQLLADLDGDDFKVRDAATRELIRLDGQIEPEARRALEGKPSPEVRKRVEGLLSLLEQPPTGELLGGLRAVRVLERVGSGEARAVLKSVAEGSSKARLTREAKAASERGSRP